MMPTKSDNAESAQYWRTKFDKQQLLLTSIVSLLNKYGNCLDRLSLYREFVLTLMGQYLVSDACYYSATLSSMELEPVVAYGRLPLASLKNIKVDERLTDLLSPEKHAQRLDQLPTSADRDASLKALEGAMQIVSPVYLGERMTGLLFLGEKISKKAYSVNDLELLHTLCAASAVTFSNAKLFDNVKSSMEEIERLSDLRTEMINRITHEFRTPLTAIRASLGCLSESAVPEAIANGLEQSVDRLQRLIDSLLELRGDAGERSSSDVFNPMILIHECISANNVKSASKQLTFQIKEDPDLGPTCLALSRTSFKTVVDKLLENAVKFSREGSTIIIDLRVRRGGPDEALYGTLIADWRDQTRKSIDQYRSLIEAPGTDPVGDRAVTSDASILRRRHLVLSVTDSGIGIPVDELKYLGEPFRQASNSPDRNVKGKALGLAVVRKILSECRGHLCCSSEEGVATTFSVFIPVV